jgi:amidase
MLDAISGYFLGDPFWLNNPEPCFLDSRTKVGLNIAFSTSIPSVGEADGNCQQGVLKAVRLLEELGHNVVEKCPDISGLVEPFQVVWQAGVAAARIPPQILQPLNRFLLERTGSAGEYLQAVTQMQILSRQIVSFFDPIDILVLPVYLHSPMKIGEWSQLNPDDTLERIIKWIAPCPIANATGLPAMSIPMGFDANGLPLSVQLIGKPAAEATLISIASQLEMVNPWVQHQWPPE